VGGATTLDETEEHRKGAALERRSKPVFVASRRSRTRFAILRGLKEAYEVHHGIRITDNAIVVPRLLSHRLHHGTGSCLTRRSTYPTRARRGSALAASAIDSCTGDDEVERKIVRLRDRLAALKKEKDQGVQETPDQKSKRVCRAT